MTDYKTIIKAKTEWTPLNQMPMGRGPIVKSMCQKYNVEGHGVYQLALKSDLPIDDIVHKSIGYTGMSSYVFSRVTGIKNGKHNAGKMLIRQGLKHDDVMIRYLFTDDQSYQLLETLIHTESVQQFGYTFKWRNASGGTDGISTRILTDIDKVEHAGELVMIIKKAEERFGQLALAAAKDGVMKDFVADYFSEDE
jgi:hypothetical protein